VLVGNAIDARIVHPATETLQRTDLDPGLRAELEACVARTVPVVSNLA
jgi:hypothetical protein